MTASSDLVARLEAQVHSTLDGKLARHPVCVEAADRILALEAHEQRLANHVSDQVNTILALEADKAALVETLTQRDGGTHDTDCKVYRGIGCNCGHSMTLATLAKHGGS